MKAISKKSMKKPSTNTSRLTTTRKPDDAARHEAEEPLDPQVAVDRAEDQREASSTRSRMNMTKVVSFAVWTHAPARGAST